MVSINGLPPSAGLPGPNRASRAQGKDNKPSSANDARPATHPTAVANAVSRSLKSVNETELENNQIHYDLPEGKSRRALEEYYAVSNQARKDELTQMLGVDIYI